MHLGQSRLGGDWDGFGGEGFDAGVESAAERALDEAVDEQGDDGGEEEPGEEAEGGLVSGAVGLHVEEEVEDEGGVEEVEGVAGFAEGLHGAVLEEADTARAESEAVDEDGEGGGEEGCVENKVRDVRGEDDEGEGGGEAGEGEGPGAGRGREVGFWTVVQEEQAGGHAHEELRQVDEGVELEEVDPGAESLGVDGAFWVEARVGEGAGEGESAADGGEGEELAAGEARQAGEKEGEEEIEEGFDGEAPGGHIPGEGGLRKPALEEGEVKEDDGGDMLGGPGPLGDEEVGVVGAHAGTDVEEAGAGDEEGEEEGGVDASEAGLPELAVGADAAGVGVDQDEAERTKKKDTPA